MPLDRLPSRLVGRLTANKGGGRARRQVSATLAWMCLIAGAAAGNQSWSPHSAGGLAVETVPQLVSVTFDDNFGLEAPGAHGGVWDVLAYYAGRHNPQGSGDADNFDGEPIRTT